jgi:uncharacterized Zn finger protein
MSVLFTTKENDLSRFFKTISGDDIQNCAAPEVYSRGLRYFNNGLVAEAAIDAGKAELKAIVKGKSDYTVTVWLQDGKVSGLCTCSLGEAVALINRSKYILDSSIYEFYKKYKKQFPRDAEKFFCIRIEKNLGHTGDRYYYAVADAIKQLKQINGKLAGEYLQNIRIEYKRRRSLIAILSKI